MALTANTCAIISRSQSYDIHVLCLCLVRCCCFVCSDYYVSGELGLEVYSEQECCSLCSTVPSCHYFTFYQNACYLKKDQTGRTNSQGRISGSCGAFPGLQYAMGCPDNHCTDESQFGTAVQVAQDSSVVIVALGLDTTIEAEMLDRTDYNLPQGQYDLVSTIRKAIGTKSLICVFVHGGTFALQNLLTDCDAIVDAWYPGKR